MDKPKEILGINKPCAACGEEGSPLAEDWIFTSRCNHGVHKRCAHDYKGRCGACGKKSPLLRLDEKRRTQFDHAAKSMKTLGRNEQFQAHLFKLMDDSSKHLKSRVGALKLMAYDKKEEAKVRMKSRLLLKRAAKALSLEEKGGGAMSASPEVEGQAPNEYEEIEEKKKIGDDLTESACAESACAESASMEGACAAVAEQDASPEPCEDGIIKALCDSIITLTDLLEEIQSVVKASHFHNDLTTEIGSQLCSSIKRAIGSRNYEELLTLLPDYEENLLEAVRLSEEAETKTEVAREAAHQAGRLASTWEVLRIEDKEKKDGTMLMVGPSPRVKLMLETAAEFGVNLTCLRSRIRDMVAGEVENKWAEGKIDPRDNAGLILEACDFSRGPFRSYSTNNMSWDTVNTPKNLPHIVNEMNEAKERDLKQQAMIQVSHAMLEIKERQLSDAQ